MVAVYAGSVVLCDAGIAFTGVEHTHAKRGNGDIFHRVDGDRRNLDGHSGTARTKLSSDGRRYSVKIEQALLEHPFGVCFRKPAV